MCPPRGHIFTHCDVGRGNPTPPGNLAAAAKPPGGIVAVPTNRPGIFTLPLCRGRGNAPPLRSGIFLLPRNPVTVRYFRQVCRGRIYASPAVYPSGCIAGVAATGGIYAAPTDQSVSFAFPLCRGLTRNLPHAFLFVPLAQTPPYLLSFIFYLLSLLSPFPKYLSTFLYSGCCFADRFVVYCM